MSSAVPTKTFTADSDNETLDKTNMYIYVNFIHIILFHIDRLTGGIKSKKSSWLVVCNRSVLLFPGTCPGTFM